MNIEVGSNTDKSTYKAVEPVLDRCPIVDIFPFNID